MSAPALFARTWGQARRWRCFTASALPLATGSRWAEASSGYAAVAPDSLGFGRSPKPPFASYDVACHLEAPAPLLPAGAAVVVGHSTGAILAAALAAARLVPWPPCSFSASPPSPTRPPPPRGRPPRSAGAPHRGRTSAGPHAVHHHVSAAPLAAAMAPVLMRDLPSPIAADGPPHLGLGPPHP